MATTFNVAEKQYEIRDAMEGLHTLEDFFEMDLTLFLTVHKFAGPEDMRLVLANHVRRNRAVLLSALSGKEVLPPPPIDPAETERPARAASEKRKRTAPKQPGEIPLYKVSQVRTQTSRYYGVCKVKKGNRPWYAMITREGKAWRGPCRKTEIEAAVDVQKHLGSDENVRILEALARGEKVGPDMPGMAAEEGGADYIRRRHQEIKRDATTVMIACVCGEKYPKHDHPETCNRCGAKLG